MCKVRRASRYLDVFVRRQHSKKKQLNSRGNSYLLPRYRSFYVAPSLAISFRHHFVIDLLVTQDDEAPTDTAWRDMSKLSYALSRINMTDSFYRAMLVTRTRRKKIFQQVRFINRNIECGVIEKYLSQVVLEKFTFHLLEEEY